MVLFFLGGSGSAQGEQLLSTGRFKERGAGVKGHARVLEQALSAELSQSGAFELVAGAAEKGAVNRTIKGNFKPTIDERYWVELGKEKGATHLLLGELQEDQNVCTAFAQLIHLESRKTVVTRPEYYDCTRTDLTALAGELSMQLTGKRASQASERRHRLPPALPIKIVMHGKDAQIDKKTYTFYEGESVKTPPRVEPQRPPPLAPPPLPELPPLELPSLQLPPLEPPAVEPPAIEAPPPVAAEPFSFDALAARLAESAGPITGGILLWPLVGLVLSGLLGRLSPSAGGRLLRFGLGVSVFVVSIEAGLLMASSLSNWPGLLYQPSPITLWAAPTAVLIWVIGGIMVGLGAQLSLLGRVRPLVLHSAVFAAALPIGIAVDVRWPAAFAAAVGLIAVLELLMNRPAKRVA